MSDGRPSAPGSGWPGDPASADTEVAADPEDVRRLAVSAPTLESLCARQSVCRACPRLVEWRERVAAERRRAYATDDYWGRPIPGWGDPEPKVLIVGLAPAAHGGNRTGRIFTGDRSGDWLFASLHRVGLARLPTSVTAGDGQQLLGARMVAAVRCAPPANKPTPGERDACSPWLSRELSLVAGSLRSIVALGGFAWQALWPVLGEAFERPARRPAFGHGAEMSLGAPSGNVLLIGCYHPSQQNTFTGRVTEAMLDDVFTRARDHAVLFIGGARQGLPPFGPAVLRVPLGSPLLDLMRGCVAGFGPSYGFLLTELVGTAADMTNTKHVLVVGGGYVGMYAALRLHRKMRRELRSGEVTITVVDPQSYMTYQPFLPEAAAGNVEPRHVVAPLRRVLPRAKLLNGRVLRVEHARRRAEVQPVGAGQTRWLDYDILVMAPGSISRTLPIPGLAECGIGFKTVAEAIYLRNHVLGQLDIATSTEDKLLREHALRFVFVGGGFAGVEALAELQDMARDACKFYPDIEPDDMRWVLVEATGRILPEVGEKMGVYTIEQLRRQGIEIHLETRLESAVGHHVMLDDGTEFDAGTLVWTAGVKAHPVCRATDLPVDEKGRIKARAELAVEGAEGAFTAGDCAAVPDLTKPGEMCAPNAQHAVRQARRLGDNIVAHLRGKPLRPYKHAYVGSVASLGLHRGVAQLYGVKVRGWPAWFVHRTYHLSRVPTLNRKARVVADWTLALFFRREIVSLGTLQRPHEEFHLAAGTDKPDPER